MSSVAADPIVPARACVVPRATRADGGEVLPLETHVRALHRRCPRIALVGPPGSGKTTALAHLAAALPEVDVYDDPDGLFAAILAGGARPAVIAMASPPDAADVDATLHLAPWGEAERIDYLLARGIRRGSAR